MALDFIVLKSLHHSPLFVLTVTNTTTTLRMTLKNSIDLFKYIISKLDCKNTVNFI